MNAHCNAVCDYCFVECSFFGLVDVEACPGVFGVDLRFAEETLRSLLIDQCEGGLMGRDDWHQQR